MSDMVKENVNCVICNKKIVFAGGKHVGICNLCARLYDDIADTDTHPDSEMVLQTVEDYFAHEPLITIGDMSRMVSLLKRCDRTAEVLRKTDEIREQVARKTTEWLELCSGNYDFTGNDPFTFEIASDIIRFYSEHGTGNENEEENCNKVKQVGHAIAESYLSKNRANVEKGSVRSISALLMFLQGISADEETKVKDILAKVVGRLDQGEDNDKGKIGYYHLASKLLERYGDNAGSRAFAPDRLYQDAVRLQGEGAYGEAFSRFLLIPDYMDVTERMEEMKPLIDKMANEILRNSELTGTENDDEENQLIENNVQARELFAMIDPYEDSEEKIIICDRRIEKSYDKFFQKMEEEMDDLQKRADKLTGSNSDVEGNQEKTILLLVALALILVAIIIIKMLYI